jgi:hypothetical protein
MVKGGTLKDAVTLAGALIFEHKPEQAVEVVQSNSSAVRIVDAIQRNYSEVSQGRMKKITCFRCKKQGHIARFCRQPMGNELALCSREEA